jgi:hypothetical protein
MERRERREREREREREEAESAHNTPIPGLTFAK